MRLPENILQKSKIVLHGVQGLVIFLAWAITIAIFTKDGSTDGRVKYYFALCWFCIPLLIYQTAIPQFDRVKRFSNAYAHAVIDILLAIFCILFLITSFISIKNLLYYRRNGALPGASQHGPTPLPLHDDDDQTKYAFSSNPHDEFDNEDEHLGPGPSAPNTTYELLHDSHAHENPSSNTNINTNTHIGPYDDEDTSYHSTTLANPPQLPPHRDPFRDRDPSPYRVQHPEEETGYGNGGRYDTSYGHGAGAGAAGAGDPFRDDLALSHDHGGYAGGEGAGAGGRVAFPHADYGRG
ncbi:MAG: hypothetical protein Q9221_001059 [Calogaya cf. arnoldii]